MFPPKFFLPKVENFVTKCIQKFENHSFRGYLNKDILGMCLQCSPAPSPEREQRCVSLVCLDYCCVEWIVGLWTETAIFKIGVLGLPKIMLESNSKSAHCTLIHFVSTMSKFIQNIVYLWKQNYWSSTEIFVNFIGQKEI